jgi:hypothetical protein
MTTDLAIHPTTGDLYLDGTELALVTGTDAIAQEVLVRLRWWRFEWFLDTSRGVPYLDEVLVKGVSEEGVRAVLRREIELVPDIARAGVIDVELDRAARSAVVVAAEIQTTEGETVSLTDVTVGG